MKATFDADLKSVHLKGEKGDVVHRTAIPTLVLVLDEDQCRHLFGGKLARSIWGAVGDDGKLLNTSTKPGIIESVHMIEMEGHAFRAAPVYEKVVALGNREDVELHIKMPFSVDRYPEAQQFMASHFGEGVTVTVEPVQQELELEGDPMIQVTIGGKKLPAAPQSVYEGALDELDKRKKKGGDEPTKIRKTIHPAPTPEQQAALDKMDRQRRPELVLPEE